VKKIIEARVEKWHAEHARESDFTTE